MLLLSGFFLQTAEGQTIAIHPIHAGNKEVADACYDVLVAEILRFPAAYQVYSINLNDCPPDVPAGGFPAHICPSPSLTRGAPYAITGEAVDDPDFPGSYRLRLYLWELKGNSLLVHDELTARDRESGEKQMRHLLAWLLSWIGSEKPVIIVEQVIIEKPVKDEEPVKARDIFAIAEPIIQAPAEWDPSLWYYKGPKRSRGESTPYNDPANWVYLGPEREKWLYMGLRAGGGFSQWYNDQSQPYGGFANHSITNFWAANASLQLSLHLMRHFDIQTEANFCADLGSIEDLTSGAIIDNKMFVNWSLTIPVLLKFSFRGSHLKAGIFAGAYLYLPLWQTNDDMVGDYFDYDPDLPGFIFGMSLGWKAGPGFLFLDTRFEYDGRWYSDERDVFYYRNIARFNIGYEIGLLNKKVR